MGKEIKFRAWHKSDKKMYEVYGFSNNKWFIRGKRFPMPPGAVEILQYTGIKDRNEKEIYEGDIVQFTVNRFGGNGIEKITKNGTVYYTDEMTLSVDGWILARVNSREVIGNIYENPELLADE